jgi:diguanylate cyclase (GGDEF)-like protein
LPKAIRRKKRDSRSSLFVKEWYVVALALGGAAGVGVGLFDWQAGLPWYSILLGTVIFAAGIRDAVIRFRKIPETGKIAATVEGPLLWSVIVWIVYRLSGPFISHTILLPVAFLAWLTAISDVKIIVSVSLLAVLMEGILAAFGGQSYITFALNIITFALAMSGLKLFSRSEFFRQEFRAKQARKKEEADKEEYAKDLGLSDNPKRIQDTLPAYEALDENRRDKKTLMEIIPASFNAQLEIILQALDLSTVVLLLPDRENQGMRLRSIATTRDDIITGSYPLGVGITGAFLRDVDEVSIAPVKEGYAGLPYYRNKKGVGSIFAIKVLESGGENIPVGKKKMAGLLVVDRVNEESWDDFELTFLKRAAYKIALDIEMGREFQAMHNEHDDFQRVCVGLRELNRALGIESVLEAATKAVSALIAIDFLAISLVQKDKHKIVMAEGEKTGHLLDREYPKDDGLIGQVIKLGCPLPVGFRYRGPAPVFSDNELLSGYESLLIMPLRKEDGETIGALTIASRKPGVITPVHLDILALIADQIAVKIDLGQAHEQISKLAITDGLTGLSNHRTFQHGLEMMLERAERQNHKLCLILCDIDFFKKINDNYGHPFGDQVLKKVSAILGNAVRKIDLAARYGGEEFAIVLEKSDESGGHQMAERIRKEVSSLVLQHAKGRVKVTMSFGFASFPGDAKEKQDLIDRADKALYHAKETGRNRSVSWSELKKQK